MIPPPEYDKSKQEILILTFGMFQVVTWRGKTPFILLKGEILLFVPIPLETSTSAVSRKRG